VWENKGGSKMEWENKYVSQKIKTFIPNHQNFRIRLFYLPLSKLEGDRDGNWEHYDLHTDALQNPKQYYFNMLPVTVEWDRSLRKYKFTDGFHRVNFCKKLNLPVPVVVLYHKPGTHIHIYRYGTIGFRKLLDSQQCRWEFENLDKLDAYEVICTKHNKILYRDGRIVPY